MSRAHDGASRKLGRPRVSRRRCSPRLISNSIPTAITTHTHLDVYTISLERQKVLEFFEVSVLPGPAVDPELLQHLEAQDIRGPVCLYLHAGNGNMPRQMSVS